MNGCLQCLAQQYSLVRNVYHSIWFPLKRLVIFYIKGKKEKYVGKFRIKISISCSPPPPPTLSGHVNSMWPPSLLNIININAMTTLPPPPPHFISPLIYLVIIKISFTHNHKMITLHNTTLGNGSLIKCTSNCWPLLRICDKKFTSPLEPIRNSHGPPPPFFFPPSSLWTNNDGSWLYF